MAEHGANRTYDLPPTAPFANHGKTVASWTLIWGVSLGVLVAALGLIAWNIWVIGAGAAIVVIGLVVSGILRAMGMGQPKSDESRRAASDDWYA
ncbi:HGxxPAAW family protein [Georgenia faecalis]|uniref:HGxxPAAW family protein n=1 Tax=Georgenia faecalis TaxID=2483799 RepID=A0ABV9DAQ1_9MICO|nr:HGxxPAAW family protein [Georgenia faecalis]